MPLPALITPQGLNFLKDWPGQNLVNCDNIDAHAGACLTSQSLQSYTPGFSATTTPPSLGAGSIKGFYYRIFDLIYTWGEFRFGAGFVKGSGSYTISLPFPVKSITPPSTNSGQSPILGNGMVWDLSTNAGRQPVTVGLRTSTLIHFAIRNDSGAGGRLVDGTDIPIIWASGDGLSWFARYQRDA